MTTRTDGAPAPLIPPRSAARIAIDAGLANETGWDPVDCRSFEVLRAPGVHVIGDADSAAPLPKSGTFANSTSKQAVAAAVAATVGVFGPSDTGFVETPNSGGVSPRGPLAQLAEQRRLEAVYADA
jgi:sulfide dehydrogenase [flavocytochrome c] flavoprotein chain